MLQGLPDFTGASISAPARVLPPYGGGSWTALPTGLRLASRPGGVPDLTLAKFRPERADETPPPGGTLDFKIELSYDLEGALAGARQVNQSATISPARVSSGFLRLGHAAAVPSSLSSIVTPLPVVWDGVDSGRFTVDLSPDGASLIDSMLRAGSAMMSAHAEFEYPGVAPRVAMRIVFDPAALLAELGAQVGQQGLVARSALAGYLKKPPTSLTQMVGVWSDDTGTALVDWLRARLLAPAPALVPGIETYLSLLGPAVAAGSLTWDLSEPIITWRAAVAEFDPLADIRTFVAAFGATALVTETDIPSLPTGLNRITVTANLPSIMPGMFELGVILVAPPNPPWRMQERDTTVVLAPVRETLSPLLHLGPDEPLRYNSITYAALQGLDELRGPSTPQQSATLRLHMNDFPVDFFIVKASEALLEQCHIHLTFQSAAATPPAVADLSMTQRSIAFSQPHGPEGAMLTAELRPLSGGSPIVFGPVPAAGWTLDLTSCPTYGPQQATIDVAFPPGATEYAVELAPEDGQGPPENTVYRFTPEQPHRTYQYVSHSPFHGGYRWREYRTTLPPADWSVAGPSAPLELVAVPAAAASTGGTG